MTYETPAELAALIVSTMSRVDQVMDEVELLRIAGTVATVSELPAGAAAGDTYVVQADGHAHAWLTTAWIDLGAFQGEQGPQGLKGWAPVLAVQADGARRVHRIVDWVGGQGAKPDTGAYIGATGLVAAIADAVDVRGDQGLQGDKGWSLMPAFVADGARIVVQVADWIGGAGAKPPTGGYVGASGLVDEIEDALDVRGPIGEPGPEAWAAPQPWATDTDYTADAPRSVVTQGGRSYACVISHHSDTFSTDLAAGRWILIADKGADGLGTGTVQPTGSPGAGQLARFADGSGNLIEGVNATKALVGLDQVDNTSDLDKPISTAVQAALDGKADVGAAATSAEVIRGLTRVMLELAGLRGDQMGTPNGIADDFSDSDGLDLAGSSGATFEAGLVTNVSGGPIPLMTSNTTPAGHMASASAVIGTGFEAYRAFDGQASTIFASGTSSGWLRRQLPSARTVTSYRITTTNNSSFVNRSPRDWTFRGSNDGEDWDTLDTRTNETGWSAGETRTYTIASPADYAYFELNITALNGGTSINIAALELVAADSKPALDLRSAAFAAPAPPATASLLAIVACDAAFVLNTDLAAFLSRDGGGEWTPVTLVEREPVAGGFAAYEAVNADLSAAASGAAPRWRLTGAAGKGWDITGACILWN